MPKPYTVTGRDTRTATATEEVYIASLDPPVPVGIGLAKLATSAAARARTNARTNGNTNGKGKRKEDGSAEQQIPETFKRSTALDVLADFCEEVYWPIEEIEIPNYQRDLIESRVDDLVRRFQAPLIGRLLLNQREDGVVYLVDGQHRMAVLRRLGYDHLPALLHVGWTEESERQMYVLMNGNAGQKKLTPYDLHRAGGELARAIDQTVEQYGYRISAQSNNYRASNHSLVHNITAVNVVYRIVRSPVLGGVDGLAQVLGIIHLAWENQQGMLLGDILWGIHRFLLKAQDDPRYDGRKFIKALAGVTPNKLILEAQSLAITIPGAHKMPKAVSVMLRRYYNFRKDTLQRLTYQDEV